MIVGLAVRDLTSGFGGFRRRWMEPLLPDLNPKGFKLLLEILAKSRGRARAERRLSPLWTGRTAGQRHPPARR